MFALHPSQDFSASCTAASRGDAGAARQVAANDVGRTESRSASAVTLATTQLFDCQSEAERRRRRIEVRSQCVRPPRLLEGELLVTSPCMR